MAPMPMPRRPSAIPSPRKRVLRRTEAVLPGMIGNATYAATAKMLPTIDR